MPREATRSRSHDEHVSSTRQPSRSALRNSRVSNGQPGVPRNSSNNAQKAPENENKQKNSPSRAALSRDGRVRPKGTPSRTGSARLWASAATRGSTAGVDDQRIPSCSSDRQAAVVVSMSQECHVFFTPHRSRRSAYPFRNS